MKNIENLSFGSIWLGMKGTHTGVVFTNSLGPKKLNCRDAQLCCFLCGPRGSSLNTGAHCLGSWNSKNWCSSVIGGLSTKTKLKYYWTELDNVNDWLGCSCRKFIWFAVIISCFFFALTELLPSFLYFLWL